MNPSQVGRVVLILPRRRTERGELASNQEMQKLLLEYRDVIRSIRYAQAAKL